MNYFLWGQILTLISYLIFWFSRFCKKKNDILLFDNISRCIAILSFIFLQTYDGIKNTIYVIFRNFFGQLTNKKSKTIKVFTLIMLLILLVLMYTFNYQGISTICIAICGILNLYGIIMCNEQGIRIAGMLGSLFYSGFMFFTGNITGTICEIICFFVMLISYIKYKKNNGVIFDLDGTLWEVTDSTFYSANEITNKYGLEKITKETIRKVFGLNKQDTAKLYFPSMDLGEASKLIDEIAVINIQNLKQNGGNLYSNLEEVLKKLKKKYKLFIVSNTSENQYIEAFLTSSGTKKYFDGYIAASNLNITKGEAIKKVIEENNLEKAIYVGDTIKDLEASQVAQIPFVQCKYGFGEDLGVQYSISDLEELPEMIKKILKN